MSISAITNTAPSQPVSQDAPKPAKQNPPATQPASPDSVQLSKAAQATLAALQEARETPAQTSKEAGGGDLQAQRLLAKEAAGKTAL